MIVELAAVTGGIELAASAGALAMVALLACALRSIAREPGPDEPDPGTDDGGGGGGGLRRPKPPPDPGGEPVWWPQFERDLEDYVDRRTSPLR